MRMIPKNFLLLIAGVTASLLSMVLVANLVYLYLACESSRKACSVKEMDKEQCLENLGGTYLELCWVLYVSAVVISLEALQKGLNAINRLPQSWSFGNNFVRNFFVSRQITLIIGILWGLKAVEEMALQVVFHPCRSFNLNFFLRSLLLTIGFVVAVVFGLLKDIGELTGDARIKADFQRLSNFIPGW